MVGEVYKVKQVLVLKSEKPVTQNVPIERELLWYDHEKKQMFKFNGGKLEFEYGYDKELRKYRMLPKVEEMFEKRTSTIVDENSVSTWFNLYSRYNDTTASISTSNKKGMIFDVEDNELEDFLFDLERQNMKFDEL